MRVNILLSLVLSWLLLLTAACSADEVPTYEPPPPEPAQQAQPAAQPAPAEQPEQPSQAEPAQPSAQAEQPVQPEQAVTEPPADDNEDDNEDETPQAQPAQPQPADADEPYIPVIHAHGRVSEAVVYTTNYNADSGTVWTRVSSRAPADGARDGQLTLHVTCWQGGYLTVAISGLLQQEADAGEVRFRFGDNSPTIEQWQFQALVSEDDEVLDLSARSSTPVVLYEQLTGASTLIVELVDAGIAETTFPLVGMFETPIEGNLQHCGRYAPGQTRPIMGEYVPVIGLEGRNESGIRWANWSYSDGLLFSGVTALAAVNAADMGVLELEISCHSTYGPAVRVIGSPSEEGQRLTTPIWLNDHAPRSSSWHTYRSRSVTYAGRTDPTTLFYDLLRANTVTIDFSEQGLGLATFDLSNAFTTPIQQNLERCGDYHPTERRAAEHTYTPLEAIDGYLGDATSYAAGRNEQGRIDSNVTITGTDPAGRANPINLVVGCLNEWTLTVHLTNLPWTEHETASVNLTIGNAAAPVASVWQLENAPAGSEARSPRAALLQYLLQDAAALTIDIPELEIGSIHFDLSHLFQTPIQPNLTHCGQYRETDS